MFRNYILIIVKVHNFWWCAGAIYRYWGNLGRTLACADCKRSEQRRMTDYYCSPTGCKKNSK
jgi:hypothetical protein